MEVGVPRTARRRAIAALAVIAAAVPAAAATATPSGAVFTTDAGGTAVNQNHYGTPLDVYLSGGPPCNASRRSSALPDGWYAFRVTDPSGRTDMTAAEDVQERMFRVTGGAVTESADPADHPIAATACGAVMRVGPFATDSANGVYKLWVVRATRGKAPSWAPCGAKTDNFLVDGPYVPPPPPPPPPDDGGGGVFSYSVPLTAPAPATAPVEGTAGTTAPGTTVTRPTAKKAPRKRVVRKARVRRAV
jgi:hypothetical protein